MLVKMIVIGQFAGNRACRLSGLIFPARMRRDMETNKCG
jgi:hypothetical protein